MLARLFAIGSPNQSLASYFGKEQRINMVAFIDIHILVINVESFSDKVLVIVSKKEKPEALAMDGRQGGARQT